MKHPSSRSLFDHWCERRGGRPLPERSEIDPASIRTALGDTFILTYNLLGKHPFRLAGTRVCALFARELKGHAFISLWRAGQRDQITALMRAAAGDSVAVVIGATGYSAGGCTADLELLLLPLRHCGQTHLRMIGTLAPLAAPYWLGIDPLAHLALGEHRYLGHLADDHAPPLAPAAPDRVPRIRHGLKVYEGGQSLASRITPS